MIETLIVLFWSVLFLAAIFGLGAMWLWPLLKAIFSEDDESMAYAAEPWAVGYGEADGGYLGIWEKGTDKVICRLSLTDDVTPEDEANARRIVACVNACRGMPTKEIEESLADGKTLKGTMTNLYAAFDHAKARAEKAEGELVDARIAISNRQGVQG